jgi:hypothetical protein
LRLLSEFRVPATKYLIEFVIQDLRPRLQQKMRTAQRPCHLLLLHEASADHLINRRLYESRGDRFALSSALAEVRNDSRLFRM